MGLHIVSDDDRNTVAGFTLICVDSLGNVLFRESILFRFVFDPSGLQRFLEACSGPGTRLLMYLLYGPRTE